MNHRVTGKINLQELIKLRKSCMTLDELASHFGVSRPAIIRALKVAEEKGLYDGSFTFMIMRRNKNGEIVFLTEKELDKGNPIPNEEKPFTFFEEEGHAKIGGKNKHRCLKCYGYLIPLKDRKGEETVFTHRGRPVHYGGRPIAQILIEKEYTHLCPRCFIAYAKEEEKPLNEESVECPICGNELAFLKYEGELTDLLWCLECKKGFKAGDEELKKIEKYAEKSSKQKRELENI